MVVETYRVSSLLDSSPGTAGAVVVRAVHVYCRPKPPPSKDQSFYDIAIRYGITLRELLAANPAINGSLGLVTYNGSVLQVPQRCAATAVQPPVTTIAATCPRRWPGANVTVTGVETCGSIAVSNGLSLRYLNEINQGLCPAASTRIDRGMRLCIQPPAAVSSAPGGPTAGHRRRRLEVLAAQIPDTDWGAPAVRRTLIEESIPGRCLSWRWVAEGMTCDSIAAAHRLKVHQLLNLPGNQGLECGFLVVGMRICVKDSKGRGTPSPYEIAADGDMNVPTLSYAKPTLSNPDHAAVPSPIVTAPTGAKPPYPAIARTVLVASPAIAASAVAKPPYPAIARTVLVASPAIAASAVAKPPYPAIARTVLVASPNIAAAAVAKPPYPAIARTVLVASPIGIPSSFFFLSSSYTIAAAPTPIPSSITRTRDHIVPSPAIPAARTAITISINRHVAAPKLRYHPCPVSSTFHQRSAALSSSPCDDLPGSQ
ncbi:hypothetical protein HYH02_012430 [Chlamydomonas schloesseri]|uniref:LysM domain-containing protein n=1 Tax=Chlamydomonas schloesseri TaxID=2026947 RepID=A0A835T184_9CHLO|nr:hypothetical protein HYH02_012430 [Chlamydomonas schloesseri]|eukprot:KAG2433968.1 hypothetical protein HYH02_012430 [Chlamydomonas schloesseri]